MCSIVKARSERKYGYKVVVLCGPRNTAKSYFKTYYWKKGLNRVQYHNNNIWDSRPSIGKPRIGFEVKAGFFHCFCTRDEARVYRFSRRWKHGCKRLRIIKVELLGQPYDGIHTGFSNLFDGKRCVLAKTVKWDGKFVR